MSVIDRIDRDCTVISPSFSVALASQEICDAEVCRSAVIGRPGFVCVSESSQNNTQRCKILYYCDYKPMDCGNSGQCYVETDIRPGNVSYTSKCRCDAIDFKPVKQMDFLLFSCLLNTICYLQLWLVYLAGCLVTTKESLTTHSSFLICTCCF